MDNSIIIIDSDDEEGQNQKSASTIQSEDTTPMAIKRPKEEQNGESSANSAPPNKIRRIQPVKIGEVTRSRKSDSEDEMEKTSYGFEISDVKSINDQEKMEISQSDEGSQKTDEAGLPKKPDEDDNFKNEETDELKLFIKACRRAEHNDDMKKIIKKKLLKNYHLVSSDFVLSKNFQKMLKDTALDITRDPKRVYSKIQDVVNELEARKRTKIEITEEPSEPSTSQTSDEPSQTTQDENGVESTGDTKKDEHLKKLNKALSTLKKRIDDLEEAEVNLDDDDDSAYMMKVRYEKRAIEIYHKICELTEESSHAHRIVKKPIKFKGTRFKEFNRNLNKKVNRENGFPSFYDVYRLLDYCNKEFKYRLSKYELKDVAESAFAKVGELLKQRRVSDLWESAVHYLGENKDPAKEDLELKSKLEINKDVYKKKTEELLEFYVKKQYEEGSKSEQPSTSTAADVKEEETNEDVVIEQPYEPPCSPLPQTDAEIISLIDVKAEQVIECDKPEDSSNTSVVNFSIVS